MAQWLDQSLVPTPEHDSWSRVRVLRTDSIQFVWHKCVLWSYVVSGHRCCTHYSLSLIITPPSRPVRYRVTRVYATIWSPCSLHRTCCCRSVFMITIKLRFPIVLVNYKFYIYHLLVLYFNTQRNKNYLDFRFTRTSCKYWSSFIPLS